MQDTIDLPLSDCVPATIDRPSVSYKTRSSRLSSATVSQPIQGKSILDLSEVEYWALREFARQQICDTMQGIFSPDQIMRMAAISSPAKWSRVIGALRKSQRPKGDILFFTSMLHFQFFLLSPLGFR